MLTTCLQIDPDTRPSNIAPPFTGHFKITADTPRGLQPHQPAPNHIVAPGRAYAATDRLASQAPASQADLNLKIRRNIYDSNGKDVTPGKQEAGDAANGAAEDGLEESLKKDGKQYFCNSCGKDCTRVRYHNTKAAPTAAPGKTGALAKYDLCPSCFMEGRYPNSSGPADYTKLENEKYSSIADRESPWSDSELLLLLEGLELYDENWDSVATHVGSRTREECVLKFLQLEIEDKYLEAEDSDGIKDNLAYLGNGRIPFSQADNPVMSVMGFLAGLADPSVTATAAGKTVDQMKRHIRDRLEKDSSEKVKVGADKEKDESSAAEGQDESIKDDSTMDLDKPTTTTTTSPTVVKPEAQPTSTNSPATVALSLTAARSAALASHTERHITSLISASTNLQMQKLEMKLQQFAEMESLLQAERRELERQRQRLFLDRLAFKKRVRETEDRFRRLAVDVPQEQQPGEEDGEGEKLIVQAEDETSAAVGQGGAVQPPSVGADGTYKTLEI